MRLTGINLLSIFSKRSLKSRMIILFTGIISLILLLIILLNGNKFKKLSIESAKSKIALIAESESHKIEKDLEGKLNIVRSISESIKASQRYTNGNFDTIKYINWFTGLLEKEPGIISLWGDWELKYLEEGYQYEDGRLKISTFRNNGKINFSTKKTEKVETSAGYLRHKANKIESIEEPYFYNYEGQTEDILMTSIVSPSIIDGEFTGLAGVATPLSLYYETVRNIKPYDGSYAFILSQQLKFIAFPDKDFIGEDALPVFEKVLSSQGIQEKIINGEPVFFEGTDYNGKEAFFVFYPIHVGRCPQNWSFVLVTPKKAVLAEARNIFWYSIVLGLIGIIIISALIYFTSVKFLFNPISKVTSNLSRLAMGHVDSNMIVQANSDDEIGMMIKHLNKTVEGLNKKTEFARQVGAGNYNSELELLSDEDILGMSLIEMNNNLRKAKEESEKQRKEEEKRRWINEGLAKFGEILRQNNDNIEKLSSSIVKNLVEMLDANQGGLFLVNDDGNEVFFELKAAYAYNRQKFLKKQIAIGEGLVGVCAQEGQTIYLKDIPENYITISSGLGEAKPRNLLIVPLKVEENIHGIIELASFNEFEDFNIEFVEKVSQSIAQTLQAVKTNIRTSELLEKTQQQAEEMRAQEEEVRQNLEELSTIKEELEKQTAEMEEKQKQLEWEKSLLDSLLNYLPDKIYFKDLKSRFIKVSKSTLEFFGCKTQEELAGKSDFDFFTEEHAKPAYEDEQRIIRTGQPIIGIIEKEVKTDGTVTWAETSKLPLKNSSGEIIGTFGITRDITQSKRMEEEISKKAEEESLIKKELERKAVEYQSLYQAINDSAYVIEYNTEGVITYINKAYLELLNIQAEELIGKHHSYQMEFTEEQRKNYTQFWEDLNKGIVRKETHKFSLNEKDYLFYETYTPIKDENGKVYKIMKIAFNISHLLDKESL
ncbi:PAS domain-containing protein [Tenuifilum thalassicum]|uniref:PAS domain S-box protein n=1 Tax=Tenuifilum thalassicum TaxID=2590900 RepID=A0A7D3XMA2_9BACT|nr:PAS domain-containing protein [Tenuifilum thalassicum]QKG81050.1 PAS domain S-box protein [Tenuifilum thalassicum]